MSESEDFPHESIDLRLLFWFCLYSAKAEQVSFAKLHIDTQVCLWLWRKLINLKQVPPIELNNLLV